MKREKRSVVMTVWSACYPPALYVGITLVIEMIIMIAMMFSYISENSISAAEIGSQAMLNGFINEFYKDAMMIQWLCSMLSCVVFAFLMILDERRRKQEGYIPEQTTANVAKLFLIIPLAVVSCLGFNHLISLLPAEIAESYNEIAELMYSGDKLMIVLAVVIFGPIVEELVFRGLVYRRFREILPVWPAAIISSVMFGIFHGNMVQFIYATCLGLVMVFVYEKYQSVWASILLHVAANAVALLCTFLPLPEMNVVMYLGIMAAELVLTAAFIAIIHMCVKKVKNPERGY